MQSRTLLDHSTRGALQQLSPSSMPKREQNCLGSCEKPAQWNLPQLLVFKLFSSGFAPHARRRKARATNHSLATAISPASSSQPYLFNAAAMPPRPQPARCHGCFQHTQALPPLLLLLLPSSQSLRADSSPIRKQLKEADPYRLSFQAVCATEFSAVTGLMINRHATVSTKGCVTVILR